MPKKTFSVDDFSGGANTFESPQNVAPNELVKSQGFYILPGEVGVLGDMKGLYTLGASVTAASGNIDVESGYGLFSFSHDYDMAGGTTDAGANLALSSTDYFIMMSRLAADKHNRFDVFDSADNVWRPDMIDLGGSISDARMASIKPCFFIADGALRISPGNFSQVASGGTLVESGSTGDFAVQANPGGFELVATNAGFDADIAPGDTIIVGKSSADTPGQEMVALITADQELTAARNMTGSFPSVVTAGTTGHNLAYVMPDTRWRGVVKRKNFAQAGGKGTFIEWYSTYAHPRPPVTWHADLDAGTVSTQYTMPFLVGSSEAVADAIVTGAQPPMLWVVYKADNAEDNATWDGASINLYCTALYDEVKQESAPNKVASAVSVAAAKSLGVGIVVNYADADLASGAYQINRRVTGARLYYEDTTNDPGILFQLLEIDFEKGCKKSDAENFTTWVTKIANEVVQCPTTSSHDQSELDDTTNAFMFPDPPKTFTYGLNAGYPPNVNTHARYKTAVILNRRLFVGNVYQSGQANGDRMIGSPVNKFDILPASNTIDVTVGDGDQIVKLEGFADRILQFKKRTLYIVNIGGGQGGEYLESEHKNMGVQNPSQTCMTEYGVAWVNSKGVFLFDGKQVTDLTRSKLKLSSSTRGEALNVDEDNIPIIGYHPVNKWLIIHPESTDTDANDVEAWILDFKSGSWTYSKEFTTTDEFKTNMVWTGDDELVFAAVDPTGTPNFLKYQAGTSCNSATFGETTKLELLTKEFDLELPGVKKTLKSVHVTYSAAAHSSIEADIIYKDSSGQTITALEEEKGGSTYYTEALGFKSTSSAIRTVRLTPVASVKKAYTFQLKLHNPDVVYAEGADFKLYNISFAYRMLGAK